MKAEHESLLANERGVTLVELLASIVIVTIILISVISIFNLTMKSNRTSEEIIDATYVAQTEMEKIYALSKKDIPNPKLTDIGYEKLIEESGWDIYQEETQQYEGFFVQVNQKKTSGNGIDTDCSECI
ncbi:MAG TPA: type II secretion system protein [Pseudogracilibacillus sp.]|nr:type II secretion system protein [Pseudogracilibacillus sp.]